jgi:LmbE family N-acetylglucosaminyl deacetylase
MPSAGKALAVVAHPDDCIIFALPFIEKHNQFNWHIAYLTYTKIDPRAQEVSNFWAQKKVTTEFLGFVDDYQDQQTQKFNFWDPAEAEKNIHRAINAYEPDFILTHNQDGDYGHIHHKLVSNSVAKTNIPQIYFASTFNATDEFEAQEYDLDTLPMHKNVIEDFQDRLIGRYIITDRARSVLVCK